MIDLYLGVAADAVPGLPGGIASLGVIAVALLVGQLVTYRYLLLPERTRTAKFEDEVKRLNSLTIDRVVPALVSATDALSETQRLLAELQRRNNGGSI